ncbi:hypothetical protein HYC85_025073 [Camellia sinensis]|uniref:Thioredoxin domain-containing protein n=1 Tax=Camellia sinensis TaxID=4442 RepID=A0A7J7GAF6_CAMSI|nr:hypothetical protein HYC85_025073 [Camellia sinensis]
MEMGEICTKERSVSSANRLNNRDNTQSRRPKSARNLSLKILKVPRDPKEIIIIKIFIRSVFDYLLSTAANSKGKWDEAFIVPGGSIFFGQRQMDIIRNLAMDKHLSILAKQHIMTCFVKIHAEKSPFLAEKLKIVVLPTLAFVNSAKVDDYVVGFNELGGTDEFSIEKLEERLAKAQVIFFESESSLNPSKSSAKSRSVRQSSNSHSSGSDS